MGRVNIFGEYLLEYKNVSRYWYEKYGEEILLDRIIILFLLFISNVNYLVFVILFLFYI